jgi:hypothetical protein
MSTKRKGEEKQPVEWSSVAGDEAGTGALELLWIGDQPQGF